MLHAFCSPLARGGPLPGSRAQGARSFLGRASAAAGAAATAAVAGSMTLQSRRKASATMRCPSSKNWDGSSDKVVHLIRHGITEMNVYLSQHHHDDPDFQDPLLYDTRLTRRGAEEAMRVSHYVHKLSPPPELLVISPLTRALETAENAFGKIDVPVTIIQPLCRERLYHSSDVGRHWAVLQDEFPQYDFSHLPDIWWYNAGSSDASAIVYEPAEDFEARVEAFRLWLASRPEQSIAVVTHHGLLLQLTGHNFQNCEMRSVLMSELELEAAPSVSSSNSTMSLVAAEAVGEGVAVADVVDVFMEEAL